MPALTWAPPAGWESYETVNISTSGALSKTLVDGHDYKFIAPNAPITGTVVITGGRNIVWIGGFIGGRTTQPALNSSYDSSGRGVRVTSNAGSANRILFFEGIMTMPGTYLSDMIQFYSSTAPVSGMNFYLQNVNARAWNWGNNQTSPNVHADLVQFYAGPTNVFMDRIRADHQTYQGLYLDAKNQGTTPGGTKVPWHFKNIYMERVLGTGQPSGISCALNTAASWAGPDMIQENIYVTGFKNISVFGGWPSDPEFHEGVTPPADNFVDTSNWNTSTYTYTSPGYSGTTADASVLASAAVGSFSQRTPIITGGGLVTASAADMALAARAVDVLGSGAVDVSVAAALIQMNATQPIAVGGNVYPPGRLSARIRAGV